MALASMVVVVQQGWQFWREGALSIEFMVVSSLGLLMFGFGLCFLAKNVFLYLVFTFSYLVVFYF